MKAPKRKAALAAAATVALGTLALGSNALASASADEPAGPFGSITGSGWRGNVQSPTTPITHFVVSARAGADGASGTFKSQNSANPLLNFDGQVTCIDIAGDRAIVGGIVIRGGEPGQVGTGFAVGFIDNNGLSPDTVTFSDLVLPPPVDCAAETDLFDLTTFPVLNGNIVVR